MNRSRERIFTPLSSHYLGQINVLHTKVYEETHLLQGLAQYHGLGVRECGWQNAGIVCGVCRYLTLGPGEIVGSRLGVSRLPLDMGDEVTQPRAHSFYPALHVCTPPSNHEVQKIARKKSELTKLP